MGLAGPMSQVEYAVAGPVGDGELNDLHALAFEHDVASVPWGERLALRSLLWVTARRAGELVGFVNVIGDGGAHGFLLDTCVRPDVQGQGIGRRLVLAAADGARDRGCHWLHVDYEPHLRQFYETTCGMTPTAAALLPLRPDLTPISRDMMGG